MPDSCPNCGHPPCCNESASYSICVRPKDHEGRHRSATGASWPQVEPEHNDGSPGSAGVVCPTGSGGEQFDGRADA